MLPSSALTWMQDMQERAMPGTVVILRKGLTENGMGGFTESWPASGTVTGRIYPVPSRAATEFVAGAQVISETKWYATLPVGTTVTTVDRLRANGRTWEITKVNNDEDWQTAVRCELVAHNEQDRTT